jgi:manganese/zinc/iron transport system ATP- binding protein
MLQIANAENVRAEAQFLRENPFAIRGLTVPYDQKPAVFLVDATFQPGKMTAIVGPNGAGKSTLIKAALGIIKPLSGQVTIMGRPVAAEMHRIAYVPSAPASTGTSPCALLTSFLWVFFAKPAFWGVFQGLIANMRCRV